MGFVLTFFFYTLLAFFLESMCSIYRTCLVTRVMPRRLGGAISAELRHFSNFSLHSLWGFFLRGEEKEELEKEEHHWNGAVRDDSRGEAGYMVSLSLVNIIQLKILHNILFFSSMSVLVK